jgi:hypothetical protein
VVYRIALKIASSSFALPLGAVGALFKHFGIDPLTLPQNKEGINKLRRKLTRKVEDDEVVKSLKKATQKMARTLSADRRVTEAISNQLNQEVEPATAVAQVLSSALQLQQPLSSAGISSAPFNTGLSGTDQYLYDA